MDGAPADDVTAYFITTERVHAAEALRSLAAQGLAHPVKVVANVRPLAAAHMPTLECPTPYCLVLDDDVVLYAGVVAELLELFRAARAADPAIFKLNARVYSEVRGVWDMGGLKLLYTPLLQQVGWPDEPHVSFAQRKRAKQLGFTVFHCDIRAGIQRRGTNLDVYKKFLWVGVRARASQLGPTSLDSLVGRAETTGSAWLWFGVLGLVDGEEADALRSSKDELYIGPIGRTLDLNGMQPEDLRRVLLERGLIRPGA
jgi:hypothetical protein